MSVTTLFGRPARYSPDQVISPVAPVLPAQPVAPTPVGATGSGLNLPQIVSRVANTPSLWRRHAHLAGHDRSWTRITVPENIDVWVIVWGTSSRTELHDHGDAETAFTTVRGRLTEIRPDASGRLIPRRFAPGVIATVAPGELHDVTNEFAETAVSIHAYAPRLETMTFYARGADGLFVPDRTSATTLPEL